MPDLEKSLADFAEGVRVRWGVPGVSLSLLDGTSRGFGKTPHGPMTPESMVYIGSNMKLFTAVAIGILVDQGKLSLDSKIKDLIPGFTLKNEHTSNHVTLIDALSHSTGVANAGSADYAFLCKGTKKEILDHLSASRCHAELRQSWVYDNRWFTVAAYIIEQYSGQTYAHFIEEHIVKPLGMQHSTMCSIKARPNIAMPSITLDDASTMLDLPFYFERMLPGNPLEGPGGLFTTSSDMMKWISFLMKTLKDELGPDEARPISAKTLGEIIKPRVVCNMQQCFFGFKDIGEATFPEFSTPLYGLGVERHQLHGINVAAHHGGMPGYGTFTLWTPDRDFGIAIVANQTWRANAAMNIIALRAFEDHFGIEHIDWEKRVTENNILCQTGPDKLPKRNDNHGPVIDVTKLKGTYQAEGLLPLHIVGAEDQQVPETVRALRARFLEQPYWGRLVAPISLMAIWDTNDAILRDFASLHHLGGNVYYGEWFKRYSAQGPEESVVGPMSAVGESNDSLFYAFEGPNGEMHLEVVHSAAETAPVASLGQGDFTFTRLQTFD